MEGKLLYDSYFEIPFSLAIPIYFWFTGLSAGAFIISTLSHVFGLAAYKKLAPLSLVTAFLLLAVAPLFLIADLGRPERFWYLMVTFNPTSIVSWGSALLVLYPVNCLVYGYYMILKKDAAKSRLFGGIGIPLALSVHGYTGFILGLVEARALWHTALMPVIFLASAVVSGLALMIILALVFNPRDEEGLATVRSLGTMLRWSIVLDVTLIAIELVTLLNGGKMATEAAEMLLWGSYSNLFLYGELLMGAVVPFAMLSVWKKSVAVHFVASVFVVAGILVMRYVWVIGGLSLPIS